MKDEMSKSQKWYSGSKVASSPRCHFSGRFLFFFFCFPDKFCDELPRQTCPQSPLYELCVVASRFWGGGQLTIEGGHWHFILLCDFEWVISPPCTWVLLKSWITLYLHRNFSHCRGGYGWHVCTPQAYIETLTLNVMVLRGGALGR